MAQAAVAAKALEAKAAEMEAEAKRKKVTTRCRVATPCLNAVSQRRVATPCCTAVLQTKWRRGLSLLLLRLHRVPASWHAIRRGTSCHLLPPLAIPPAPPLTPTCAHNGNSVTSRDWQRLRSNA